MLPQEHTYTVLIVSGSAKFAEALTGVLPPERFTAPTHVFYADAARRALAERPYDLCLINTPLPDEFGRQLALDIVGQSDTGVLLFVRGEVYEEVLAAVGDYGVPVLPKPTNPTAVTQSLNLLLATRARLRHLKESNASLIEKMEEVRLVNRAKWVLIEVLKMTENDAHRYIEKQAMDLRLSRREVAETIIKTYR